MEHCICKWSTPFIFGGLFIVLTQMAPHRIELQPPLPANLVIACVFIHNYTLLNLHSCSYSHLPLAKRVLRTHLKPLSVLPPTGPRGAYRGWEEVNLVNAMLAVDKGVSLRRAAEMYKIPRSTLHDHVSGKIALGARSGPHPYLSVEEHCKKYVVVLTT